MKEITLKHYYLFNQRDVTFFHPQNKNSKRENILNVEN